MPSLNPNTLTKTHFDSLTDNPRLARSELEKLFDYVNALAQDLPTGSSLYHSNNQGNGSGLDAERLAGQLASYYLNLSNATGSIAQSAVTGLVAALNGKASTVHSHSYVPLSNVTVSWNSSSRYIRFRYTPIMIQAVIYTSKEDGDETFSFPVSFSSCYGVVTSRNVSGAGVSIAAFEWNSTSFTVNRDNGLDGDQLFSMIAFGTG